jgi:hypothetical protein
MQGLDAMINRIVSACIFVTALFGSIVYVFALPGFEVIASPTQPAVKGDRLDIRPLGNACGEQAWPYYTSTCVLDPRRPDGRARAVRIVSPDQSSALKLAPQIAK